MMLSSSSTYSFLLIVATSFAVAQAQTTANVALSTAIAAIVIGGVGFILALTTLILHLVTEAERGAGSAAGIRRGGDWDRDYRGRDDWDRDYGRSGGSNRDGRQNNPDIGGVTEIRPTV
jgi:hypothetical protein